VVCMGSVGEQVSGRVGLAGMGYIKEEKFVSSGVVVASNTITP
jgi:hypothetical protein